MEAERYHKQDAKTGFSDALAHEVKRSQHGIKLEPQPSDDPEDPLNWPMRKKILILGVIGLSAFTGVAQAGANISGIVVQSLTYHVSVGAMVDSVSNLMLRA